MSERWEELEKLLAEKVEKEEEWDLIDIDDVRLIYISKIRDDC